MQEERIYKCWDAGIETAEDENINSITRSRVADAPAASSSSSVHMEVDSSGNPAGEIPPPKIRPTPKAKSMKQQAKSAACWQYGIYMYQYTSVYVPLFFDVSSI